MGRHLHRGERIAPGSEVIFNSHCATVGDCLEAPLDLVHGKGSRSHSTSRDGTNLNSMDHGSSSHDLPMSVHESLSLSLDFSHGIGFAKEFGRKFLTTVHPSYDTGHFILVVSFARASFRLDSVSVGMALEVVIGGSCDELKVSDLRDRVFSFNVSSKAVGFQVYNLHKYECKQFKCFFHLWGQGGN